MRRALALARSAVHTGEVPVGAVVFETATGRVIGEAFNRREGDHDPAAHAEFLAIRAASREMKEWRLVGCSLVVTLEPCVMCAGLIVNARVDRVLYGASDPKAGACESLYRVLDDRRLNHRPQVIGGVLAHESAELLRAFFRARRARTAR
ncbi:MAG: nucleoside deaminase [Phycisphaeraceae bacterium]|nr:nucleoside deaminase [Phycisphaeraceae bacterium]